MKTSLVDVLVAAAVLASTLCQESSDESLVVQTVQGRLRGNILISRKGRQIYSFRGIRFAEPPVGNLRFKAPVPPKSWTGIRNATEDGFSCPQPVGSSSALSISEDCLFLNVYTMALPKSGENPNRPVVVYFHSGAWYYNTGVSTVLGPQYLLDQDIVLVTNNYRLGALGFISTGDGVLQGNNGMKDQVATLRWVKQNIAAFGGNPKEVTIAGCSAGAVSVWFHMISPMSRGLFNKAISLSMGLETTWDVKKDPLTQAKRQAALLNCTNDTSVQIAECLRTKIAQEIASTYNDLLVWASQPILEYTPVIEEDYGQERFLTENPIKSILEGNYAKVPWITGITKNEKDQWAYFIIQNQTLSNEFYQNFEELAPISLGYESGTERSCLASQAFKKFYLKNQPITNRSMTDLANLYSDARHRYGHDITSKLASKLSDQPVYSYQFEYQGRYSHRYVPGTQVPFGVVHEDDLIYLFYMSRRFPEFKPEDPETQMVEKLTTLWANFIYTGNPTPNASTILNNVIWEKFTAKKLSYLSIDSELKMKTGGLYQDRMAVWEKYFPAKV